MYQSILLSILLPLCFVACSDDTSSRRPAAIMDAASSSDGSIALQPDTAAAMSDDADAMSDSAAVISDGAVAMSDTAADAAPLSGALEFDGVNDLVELPTALAKGANESAFTVEVWFNTTSATGPMFEVYGVGGGADRFIFLDTGKVCFYVYGSPVTKLCSTAAGFNDGTWHHAAGTMGAQGGMRVYADGVMVASSDKPSSSNFTTDSNFRLGYGHTAFLSALVYYKGKLDEVRVWRTERTATEIADNYRSHLPGNTVGLQGYWPLDEVAPAMTTKDLTTPAHDGVLKNFTFTKSPWTGPPAF